MLFDVELRGVTEMAAFGARRIASCCKLDQADLLGDTCACDYSGNDEWLPYYCEFSDNVCPNTVGVACWEQYLTHKDKREERDD